MNSKCKHCGKTKPSCQCGSRRKPRGPLKNKKTLVTENKDNLEEYLITESGTDSAFGIDSSFKI